MIELGHRLRRITEEKGVPLLVNDRVDVALAIDADGVHVGQVGRASEDEGYHQVP